MLWTSKVGEVHAPGCHLALPVTRLPVLHFLLSNRNPWSSPTIGTACLFWEYHQLMCHRNVAHQQPAIAISISLLPSSYLHYELNALQETHNQYGIFINEHKKWHFPFPDPLPWVTASAHYRMAAAYFQPLSSSRQPLTFSESLSNTSFDSRLVVQWYQELHRSTSRLVREEITSGVESLQDFALWFLLACFSGTF